MFNDLSSPLAMLKSRRSGKPRDMIAPGPDAAQLDGMLAIAARTPDHGKLAPWRLVIIGAAQREAFAQMLVTAYRADKPEAGRLEIEAVAQFAHQAPALVAVLSTPVPGSHIPLWEQRLSAGAVCMNLEHAAHAMGFVACWLTGWAAYDETVLASLGGSPGRDRVAGFIFIGTPGKPLEERPRPDRETIISEWRP